ncbi:hypothetical protein GCM10010483_19390 [Actinokineospora diospyrosa]
MEFEIEKDTVRRFVVRARRVAAHSLVRDWERLIELAQDRVTMRLSLTGVARTSMRLPEDEEVFESLVARLRPFLLKDERVHHARLFKAIKRMVVQGGTGFDEDRQGRFDELRAGWQQLAGDTPRLQTYSVQGFDEQGQPLTPVVADAVLAAGWLYADLVHAQPRPGLEEAARFSLAERYTAAVRLFSKLAMLTAHTLAFINQLRDDQLIEIGRAAWDTPVEIDSAELTQEGVVFVAPAGTEGPAWIPGSLEVAQGWRSLTTTEAIRMDTANQVEVVLSGDDGERVAAYEAAVLRRDTTDTELRWRVLVNDAVEFTFALDITAEVTTPRLLHWDLHQDTNRQLLVSSQFLLEMYSAAEVGFDVHGHRFIAFTATAPAERLAHLRALSNLAQDLVLLENRLGQALHVCDAGFNQCDQVVVRIIRLLHEGRIVPFGYGPMRVAVDSPEAPAILGQRATEFGLGSCRIPVPAFFIGHPQAVVHDLSIGEHQGPGRMIEYGPPAGERLIAWSPDCGAPKPELDELSVDTDWGLPDIDQHSFPW